MSDVVSERKCSTSSRIPNRLRDESSFIYVVLGRSVAPNTQYVNMGIRNICSIKRYDVISGVDRNGEGDDHDHDVGEGDYDYCD